MGINLKNSSTYIEKKGNTSWWNWTAYIECDPPDSLDEIEFVEYHLHPSFPNPIRRVMQKQKGFPMQTKGWGIFNLRARVVFKDPERRPEVLEHMLQFDG